MTAICSKCRHCARGEAIDMRPRDRSRPPPPPRPRFVGGEYICAREGLTPGDRDPVAGDRYLPSGPDCRDLNPDGACPHYRRGVQPEDVTVALFILAGVIMFGLPIAGLAGWLP